MIAGFEKGATTVMREGRMALPERELWDINAWIDNWIYVVNIQETGMNHRCSLGASG
jgi:hypothetical protein